MGPTCQRCFPITKTFNEILTYHEDNECAQNSGALGGSLTAPKVVSRREKQLRQHITRLRSWISSLTGSNGPFPRFPSGLRFFKGEINVVISTFLRYVGLTVRLLLHEGQVVVRLSLHEITGIQSFTSKTVITTP